MRSSDDERDHLFHLASHRPPPAEGVARLVPAPAAAADVHERRPGLLS
ncbi:hypothetical protein [Nonomuraea insulae]|uniref:Uncharacterized protein n=1 Tax=Nonomuraea insulae TaxID=1616787 RepID=A0ABW1CUR9_9ACTN